VAKKKLGGIFCFFLKFSKNGKQIAKILETIKLSKKLMPIIEFEHLNGDSCSKFYLNDFFGIFDIK
jgi:hypothetical protein